MSVVMFTISSQQFDLSPSVRSVGSDVIDDVARELKPYWWNSSLQDAGCVTSSVVGDVILVHRNNVPHMPPLSSACARSVIAADGAAPTLTL